MKDNLTDTKNEKEKRILPFFMIGQSFVKSIGVFPGVRGTSLKIRPGLKELSTPSVSGASTVGQHCAIAATATSHMERRFRP